MLTLVDLDNKRIAILLRRAGQTVVLTGVGVSTSDPTLGNVLRVELDEEYRWPDNPTFLFPEADIDRSICRQSCHGCDYCATIDQG